MEQMSGARRSGRLLARFEEVMGDHGGGMPLTQSKREVTSAVEGTLKDRYGEPEGGSEW
jgi:hypothetical protein